MACEGDGAGAVEATQGAVVIAEVAVAAAEEVAAGASGAVVAASEAAALANAAVTELHEAAMRGDFDGADGVPRPAGLTA